MSPRRGADTSMAAREAALQMLYALDLGGGDAGPVATAYRRDHPMTSAVADRAAILLQQASTSRQQIEELIGRHSVGWRLERMSAIDRNLLKLGTAEMLTGQPSATVVQATVRLARKFSQPEAISFVQGLLEAIARELAAKPEVAQHAE
ncbi:MAG TPA: transcription antitermination factor NusB [Terriglobales bacterium]|nr:transcription antitermination factor NusB [Terriglobales bacterium]